MADTRYQQLLKTDRNPIEEREFQQLKIEADANNPVLQAQKAQEAALARQKAETDARFATNKADLTNFNTRFSTAVPQIINDTSNKYQLGQLLGQTNALGSRVSDLQTNSSGTGAGGYASAGQVDKAISTNYLPRYQQAVTNLQTGTSLAQQEQNQLLTPFTTEASLLNDRLAREATGYSDLQQRELDSLIQRMNAGVALTKAEMDNANALAIAEASYQNALDVQKSKNSAPNTEVITVGGRKKLIDKNTGNVIADLGSSSETSSGFDLSKYLTPSAGTPSYFKPLN